MSRNSFTVAAMMPILVSGLTGAEPRMLPRGWAESLPLSRVVVIAADAAVSARLREALVKAGADAQVVPPDSALAPSGLAWTPEVRAATVMVVGGIHTNRALLPLYAAYLAFGDAAYPGSGGFVVRTITRPFGPGTGAIAIEASDSAGEAAGVARCIELLGAIREAQFPKTLEAHLAAAALSAAQQAPDPGMRYVLTGAPDMGAKGIQGLLKAMDPERGFAGYGDYGIERWVAEYNYLQDAPGTSADVVRTLDQGVLATLLQTQNEYWRARGGSGINGRHLTMGTSAFLAGVHLLLRRGAPDAEAQKLLETWRDQCEAYWRNAASAFDDDLEGIPSYFSPEPTLDWALRLGVDGYVREQLPLAVLRAYTVMDNLGFYAGTGTYEECRPGDLLKPVPWGRLANVAHFFHPQRGYAWLPRHMPVAPGGWALGRQFGGARTFALPDADQSRPPEDLLGIVRLPLGPYRYAHCAHDRDAGEAGTRQPYLAWPQERCFEKLCFRDRFEPDGQYFVLEGFQTPRADNQPPLDANTLLRYTDLGHVWLCTNTEKQGNLFRTAVFCTDGLNDGRQPAGCELQAVHNGAQIGLAASWFPDYVAADWTRNVIWRRGRYFVLIDLLRQTREGRFGLICSFRTPHQAWLEPDGMRVREGLAEMRVRNADAARLALEGGDEIEGATIPTLLRETQLLDGRSGDVRAFRNLVYAADPAHPADLELRPLNGTAALVRGTVRGEAELALVAAAPAGVGIKAGPFATDAQVLYVGSGGWAQAGGTGLSFNNRPFEGRDEGVVTAEASAALKRLWDEAKPPDRPTPATQGGTDAKRRWRFDGFANLPAAVPAPVLACDPAPASGVPDALLDGIVTRWPKVGWPAGRDVTLSLDLRESRALAQIDFHTAGCGMNVIVDPANYPKPRLVRVEFSNDAFQADTRRRDLTTVADCTYEGLHKATVFPIQRWMCRDIAETARYVRLTFPSDAWAGGFGLSRLAVRPVGANSARIVGLRLLDVNNDGVNETVAWTDQAELVALRDDGTPLLTARLGGFITAVESYSDLVPDGPRLLVTTREARLYCLKPDGTEAWKTDFLASGKLNTDLPIAYSIGVLRKPDGTPLIATGNYNLASFVSATGEVLKYERLPGAYQTMALARGSDVDGDGRQDFVTTEVWGILSVLDTDMRRRGGCNLPRGRGIRLDYWPTPNVASSRAVVCTENGFGVLDLKTLKYDWLRTVRPISTCVVADVNGDAQPELVLGKQDGWLLIYSGAGATLRTELIGEAVRALAVVRTAAGHFTVVMVVPGRLDSFDPLTGARATLALGEFTHLAADDRPGIVIAAGAHAVLEAIEVP